IAHDQWKIILEHTDPKTSFEEWARPGQFSRTIAKGPDTTTWIWNLHVDAHNFDSHTSYLEELSQKVFSAHFGQLSTIFLWLSTMYFHGARFSNYEVLISDPTHIGPSVWRASGITSELQLNCTTIGSLVFADLMLFAGWFHYHKAAPKLALFQDVESMLNHHLTGLLGLGSLSWAGHHFCRGSNPIFTLNRSKYADFLTFREGLDPVIGGLWLTDIAHQHLDITILFLIANQGHKGLYEILTTSWHSTDCGTQLSLFTHHMWIGEFLIVCVPAHAAIFIV
uniref:Photosystem I chlorophyll a apoprotein A1 n=1 Tax=Solanum lycopersicum TaxID=4081 RepID=A0A3Q7EW35_SOLLC